MVKLFQRTTPHPRLRHRRADAEHIRPETNPIQVSFRMEEYIMKKLSKRFLTLAIACVMAMMMAVPAFADFDNGTTHTYHIKNNTIAGDYVYLNLYGTGGVYASRNVTVYPRTTSDDQVL
jgi:hypothetical protein